MQVLLITKSVARRSQKTMTLIPSVYKIDNLLN